MDAKVIEIINGIIADEWSYSLEVRTAVKSLVERAEKLDRAAQSVIDHAWPTEGGEFADDDNATLALTELKAALASIPAATGEGGK